MSQLGLYCLVIFRHVICYGKPYYAVNLDVCSPSCDTCRPERLKPYHNTHTREIQQEPRCDSLSEAVIHCCRVVSMTEAYIIRNETLYHRQTSKFAPCPYTPCDRLVHFCFASRLMLNDCHNCQVVNVHQPFNKGHP